ncbi:MAG: FxLYD domain-containing protein [Accumulibacter sp.]|jgi:hypothetical protein|uniref:FxLYD domain-containing protein n=1 Tax=Accumulibacter sp. TaxID=2053492 RepID=UPI002FC2F1DA
MKLATASQCRLLITAVIVITLTAACNQTPPEQPAAKGEAHAPPAATPEGNKVALSGLSLVDAKIARNSAGTLVVQGRVNNASKQAIGHAEAELRLLDKNGVAIGTVTPAVNNLQAGFAWNFETAIEQQNAVSAELVGFTGK